jgi:hypothetical protein
MLAMCSWAGAAQSRKNEITLVLVPREKIVQKFNIEVGERYPTLLVSYLVLPTGAISLHGWAGKRWVNISYDDYVAGSFFKKKPSSALIVEKAGVPIPKKLIPPTTWCSDVFKITTTQLRPLVHLTGQYFGFGYKDWSWFSKRSGFAMEAINPEYLNVSWFRRSRADHADSTVSSAKEDGKFWVTVRQVVVTKKIEEPVPVETTNTVEMVENPFTNDVPPAVVMGASDVSETDKKEGGK